MSHILVSIMMGSKNDLSVMEDTLKTFKEFGVGYEAKVLSAHRTPKETVEYAEKLKSRGIKVVICGAGASAALAGTVAAHSDLPVLGVPIDATCFHGWDALLSTVQMPPGIPVASLAVGKMGARNAALFALRILALQDDRLADKLVAFKEEQRKTILDTKIEL
ncbi:MAG: 5-(carboxyamino)imidazole ribonucleotide mutase [Candidatus Omnitrophica bacterium]|nr:5-(carboxyamino)imidazole ribonucleotide mutase [Candidatus Omnitrophota bacterium]